MKTILQSVLIIILATIGIPAFAGLAVLEGEHTVVYDIVNPRGVAFVPNYSNESFEQKVISQDEFSMRVEVKSKMHPLKTRVPYPIPSGSIPSSVANFLLSENDRQSQDPSLTRLVRELTRDSSSAHEAVHAILSWIADTLTFDSTISVPSDAISALRYKKAYCVGYSNLAVAMLRAAGIPARVAHGYLPPGYEWGFSKEYWGVKVNDGGFHAYLELYYPDAGWVFADAEHSYDFVDPFHIILRIDGVAMPGSRTGGFLEVDKATFYTIFKEENNTMMVDEEPAPKQKRLGRRSDNRQYSALITGTVHNRTGKPIQTGTAVAWSGGRGSPVFFSGGIFAVTLPQSGDYRIELRGSGFAKSSQSIRVQTGQVYHLNFKLEPGGSVTGKVLDSANKPVSEGDVFYRDGDTSFGVPIDRNGTYTIEGLAPGEYKISVMLGEKTVSQMIRIEAGKEKVLNFVVK